MRAFPQDPKPKMIQKKHLGQYAYLSGKAAEDAVAKAYQIKGLVLVETRWRGEAGEIDLILRSDDAFVFCEVKKARSFEEAAYRLRPAQMKRIQAAALEYLASINRDLLCNMRFDLAICDQHGHVEIMENAFNFF